MKRIKKLLAVLLSVLLLASLLPTGVMAAGESADWASSAVTKLNEIYDSTSFSASTDAMTEKDAKDIAETAGWTTTKLQDTDTPLSRSKACEVLAEVFSLDISSSSSAIQYLYDRNIINGTDASGTLNENGPVSHAEFAVLTYRVLNAVGGGEGSNNEALKPGTKEYFAWMYLAARACVPFNSTQLTKNMSEVSFTFNGNNVADTKDSESGENVKKGNNLWNQWTTKLTYSGTVSYDGDKSVLENAVALVSDISSATQIFSDVKASDWYYDGVMYLFDRGIVSGNGDGTFKATDGMPRYQLAMLLARLDGQTVDVESSKTYVTITKEYMKAPEDADEAWWGKPGEQIQDQACATRGEAIVAFIKQSKVNVSNVNTAILDRFTKENFISYSDIDKQCIAYAVSHGLVNGTDSDTLGLSNKTTRGEAGVLLYRTLIGVDQTKMKDYRDNVSYVLPTEEGQATQQSVENTQNTFAVTTNAATFAEPKTGTATLTLREDWRLTSDLDLNVPEGTTLTIQGNGNYIYEMGGKLLNSGLGKVVFENTILYPAEDSKEATKTTSDQLMMDRQPHKVTVGTCTNGAANISQTQAKKGDTVTVTVTPDNGYELDSITVTTTEVSGITVTVSGTTFTMPASDVTVTATFKEKTTSGGDQGGSSGGGVSSYPVKVEPQDEGSVEISSKNAQAGAKVTLTSDPKPGYRLSTISVLDGKGASVDLTKINDGTYEFVMPSGSVTVKAEFEMIPPPFEDTSDQAWYYEAVHYVYYHKIMTGTGSGEFSPNATLSRAMVAQILYNLEGQPTMTGEGTFVDAAEHWAADAIAWAKQTGVVAGYEGNIFRPEKAVTREELAQMLYNYAQYKGYNLTATGDLTVFPDGDMVQDWAETAMSWANGNKLINGSEQAGGNLILSPNGNTTRAEAASILMNFDLNLVEEE